MLPHFFVLHSVRHLPRNPLVGCLWYSRVSSASAYRNPFATHHPPTTPSPVRCLRRPCRTSTPARHSATDPVSTPLVRYSATSPTLRHRSTVYAAPVFHISASTASVPPSFANTNSGLISICVIASSPWNSLHNPAIVSTTAFMSAGAAPR